jgi:transketolase
LREQAAIGIAAGMAAAGMKPVVYGIAAFLLWRAAEFIRLDLVATGYRVKLIGYGTNGEFAHLGVSHLCRRDDIELCRVLRLPVFDPGLGSDSAQTIKAWLDTTGPAYIRA